MNNKVINIFTGLFFTLCLVSCICAMENSGQKSFFDRMTDLNFSLTPRGHGVDCYRTWEETTNSDSEKSNSDSDYLSEVSTDIGGSSHSDEGGYGCPYCEYDSERKIVKKKRFEKHLANHHQMVPQWFTEKLRIKEEEGNTLPEKKKWYLCSACLTDEQRAYLEKKGFADHIKSKHVGESCPYLIRKNDDNKEEECTYTFKGVVQAAQHLIDHKNDGHRTYMDVTTEEVEFEEVKG